MTQDQVIILMYRVVLISGLASILAFIAEYTRFRWWRSEIGRTIVVKDILLLLLFIPSTLSLFLDLNRLDSHIVAWLDLALLGLVTPVMLWRIWVWEKIHRHDGGE